MTDKLTIGSSKKDQVLELLNPLDDESKVFISTFNNNTILDFYKIYEKSLPFILIKDYTYFVHGDTYRSYLPVSRQNLDFYATYDKTRYQLTFPASMNTIIAALSFKVTKLDSKIAYLRDINHIWDSLIKLK